MVFLGNSSFRMSPVRFTTWNKLRLSCPIGFHMMPATRIWKKITAGSHLSDHRNTMMSLPVKQRIADSGAVNITISRMTSLKCSRSSCMSFWYLAKTGRAIFWIIPELIEFTLRLSPFALEKSPSSDLVKNFPIITE